MLTIILFHVSASHSDCIACCGSYWRRKKENEGKLAWICTLIVFVNTQLWFPHSAVTEQHRHLFEVMFLSNQWALVKHSNRQALTAFTFAYMFTLQPEARIRLVEPPLVFLLKYCSFQSSSIKTSHICTLLKRFYMWCSECFLQVLLLLHFIMNNQVLPFRSCVSASTQILQRDTPSGLLGSAESSSCCPCMEWTRLRCRDTLARAQRERLSGMQHGRFVNDL